MPPREGLSSLFLLCDVEEFSLEEAAQTLGISVPATKSRLFRARMALREKLTRRFKSRRAEASRFAEMTGNSTNPSYPKLTAPGHSDSPRGE